MIARDCGLGMGVCRFSRPLRGVGVITMPDAGLDTPRCTEVPPPAGVILLLVPSVAVGACFNVSNTSGLPGYGPGLNPAGTAQFRWLLRK